MTRFNGYDWIAISHIAKSGFLLHLFLFLFNCDSRNSDTGYDQRSRYDLDSTATIDRDIAYREIGILVAFVSFPFEIAIRETPTQAVINGPG
jgi:hypothetical protein